MTSTLRRGLMFLGFWLAWQGGVACMRRPFNDSGVATQAGSLPDSRYTLTVDESHRGHIDERALRGVISGTMDRFEAGFWGIRPPLDVRVTGEGCLRTGYNFETKVIAFCLNGDVIDGGSRSPDIVSHELFHALVCQRRPELCSPEFLKAEENTALHEALADLHAFSLIPDDFFGEYFYVNRPWVRVYRSDLCYSLTAGAHAKGNALASALIAAKVPQPALRDFLLSGEFSIPRLRDVLGLGNPCLASDGSEPRLPFVVEGVPPSPMHRYRIPAEGTAVVFAPNATAQRTFGHLEILWKTETGTPASGFSFTREGAEGELRYRVKPLAERGSEKVIAEFVNEGKTVGFDVFYFGVQR